MVLKSSFHIEVNTGGHNCQVVLIKHACVFQCKAGLNKSPHLEEIFLTAYQSLLDTTWQAIEGHVQCTGEFPLRKPTELETRKAYYMKNKTLIHNDIVWGEEAEEDKPVLPQQGQHPQRQQSRQRAASPARWSGSMRGVGFDDDDDDDDDDDPNERKSNANPSPKGDEAQDKKKKRETQETSHDDRAEGEASLYLQQLPQGQQEKTSAERERDEVLDKIKRLREQLEKERQQRKDEQEAARQAAEDKAKKPGEELVQEIDDDKARADKKREARREKKRRKKQKKDGQEGPPSEDGEESEGTNDEEEERRINLKVSLSQKVRRSLKTTPNLKVKKSLRTTPNLNVKKSLKTTPNLKVKKRLKRNPNLKVRNTRLKMILSLKKAKNQPRRVKNQKKR